MPIASERITFSFPQSHLHNQQGLFSALERSVSLPYFWPGFKSLRLTRSPPIYLIFTLRPGVEPVNPQNGNTEQTGILT